MLTEAVESARHNARQAYRALMPACANNQVLQAWADKFLSASDKKRRGDAKGNTRWH